jgi:hypothetical protein
MEIKFTLDKLPQKVLAKIDLQLAFIVSRIVVAAERLQVFRKLHGRELSAAAIGKKTGMHPKYRDYFLIVLVSLGLLKKRGNLYRNSSLAEKYFIRERSIFWTTLFSAECVKYYEAYSVLEEILTSGKHHSTITGKKDIGYFELLKKDRRWAREFIYTLYYDHKPDAEALAKNLSLKGYQKVLDVGGGSGVMSIELVRKFPHLKACVFDIEPVCRVTKGIIKKEGLKSKICTCVGNMNKHLPSGYDVIMFCDIYVNPSVLKMAYENLPDGGMIVRVDQFFSEDKTEPLHRLTQQLLSRNFWAKSRQETITELRACGFKALKSRKIGENLWMITGLK